ncbi:MAG TPA: aquaporin [Candidatus Saccharimonadales bacterium]|nr:aquaporin [Candidatus Saccharimonadales bacterium]
MRFGKKELAAYTAEFLGTGVLTLLVLSVQRSTIGVPFFVAIAAGLAVVVMSFAVAGTSGGYFNPALTLGMWTARKLSSVNTILFIAVQLLGAFAAFHLYSYFVGNPLQEVGGKFSGRVLTAEVVGTAIFAFGWAAAVYQRFSASVAASVAGLSLTVGIVAASAASIGILNPAVALGINAWVWGTYVLGPIVGAVIGVNLYSLLFATTGVPEAKSEISIPATPKKVAAKRKTTRAKKK